MTKQDLDTCKKAYKILKKWNKPYKCGDHCIGCPQCNITRLIEDLDSLVNFFLEGE